MGCRLRGVLALALLCIGVVSVVSRRLPQPLADDVGVPGVFSLSRARALVQTLASKPHPVGSREQSQVRDFLIEELRRNAVAVSEQSADAALSMGGSNQSAHLHNLLASIPGREPNAKAILLVAHYDTVPNSRGAGDDGAAVASLLETARVLGAGPRLRRTVHLLFTDAEEAGLLGAQAFIASNRVARQVGLVINLEARGTSGPVLMYHSSPRSGPLVADYGRSAPRPHANSLISELSQLLPNDSDASLFIKAGFPVLAFAFVEGFENYHRYTDSSENLDPRTLAHCGTQALALTQHFAELKELPQSTSDAVYFDILSRCLFHYPSWVATVLGTLCAFAWCFLVRREIRARRCSTRGVIRGAKLQLLVMGLAVVVPVMLHLLRSLMIDEDALVRNAPTFGLTDLLVVAALNLQFHTRAIRRGSARDLVMGSLSISVLLGATLGWWVPSASAPWQWVSVCACVVWRCESALSARRRNLKLVLQLVPLLLVVFLGTPIMDTALSGAGPTLMAIPLLFAASFMEFSFATLLPKAARFAPAAVGIGCLGFVLIPTIAMLPVAGRSPVATASLIYAYDSDSNRALYLSKLLRLDQWTQQWASNQSEPAQLQAFTPSTELWRQVSAPIFPQVPVAVSVTEVPNTGPQRRLDLRVSSAGQSNCVKIWQTEGSPVTALSVNSQRIAQLVRFSPEVDALGLQLLSGVRERRVWKLSYCGLSEVPLVLRVQLPPKQSVRLHVVTETPSLPLLMARPNLPGSANVMPGRESGVTWVAQQVVL